MKYWEIMADKLSGCWLVMGLLQGRHPRWLAMDRRRPSRRSPLHCHSDELLAAFLELEATLL
jgi:hypothetical protein